jgi:hypothetical protein
MARGKSSPGSCRFYRSLPFLGLGLLVFAFPPAPSHGQSPEDRVFDFLDAASGFQLLGDVRSALLQEGKGTTIPWALVEGADYMVVAYCGSGCRNLDLSLIDESGEVVQADHLPDAEPILMFTAETTGIFHIRVDVVELLTPATEVALGILGSTAEPGVVPGEDMSGRLTLVGAEFTSLGFTEIGDERVGSLNTDQTFTLPIALQAGTDYRLAGVCDQDCFDLDLVLKDPRGEEVASDVLEDALPILAHVADTTGEYQVEVIMIACGLEPCSYRLAAFARGGDVGPGGATFSGEVHVLETYQGELDVEDEEVGGAFVELYEVEARAGQRIIVDLRSDEFDTLLRLTGPGGVEEESDDYGYDTGHSHIERLVENDGTYSVQVTSFEPASEGSFVLQIAVVG